MNKAAIWAIILIMSAAMLGIAAIQMYWINFSIRLDEKKFDERVYSALKRVEERVTKAEEETANWKNIGSGLSYNSYLRIEKEEGGIINMDTAGRVDIPAYGGYDPWQKKMYYWEFSNMHSKLRMPPLQDRIDPKALGTVIDQELINRGIDLEYDYGVFDNESKDFIVINDNYTVQVGNTDKVSSPEIEQNKGIEGTPYNVDLFPSEVGSPGSLKIFFPNKRRWLWESVWPLILSSILFIVLILLCFSYVVYVIFRQKKVSEMKTDFINNMTHEFKTPIATISLAADSITNPMIVNNEGKVKRFADIIRQENKRMLSQVEKVLQMALIDKKDFTLKITPIDIHSVARQAADSMRLQVNKKDGEIRLVLNAVNSNIQGDATHISNMIHNLLDNAIKYSPEQPKIILSTRNIANGVELSVEDKGVGLSKEAKKQIFDKFYRVHTGNLHDVKGFGLGLSYVKAMMTAHKGAVEVESELGKGSKFTLTFPTRQSMVEDG